MPAVKTAGTGGSAVVERCQVCDSPDLRTELFLAYLPPVNHMRLIGTRAQAEPGYPAELLACGVCGLVQLGLIVDPSILFPPEYPYTSGTTKILRENFAELYTECRKLFLLDAKSLAVDIGSNDGTLLSNFKNGGHRVLGIEPTLMASLANERGITSMMAFFGADAARRAWAQHGAAAVVTATNVFAHIEDVHAIVEAVLHLLDDKGVFITESHYLAELVKTLQYDTVYHEHLRYYSLSSLSKLLSMHGLEVVHAKRIPTHGGSIRVYAARKGSHPKNDTVDVILEEERASGIARGDLKDFKERAVRSKLGLYAILADIRKKGGRVHGIGAPSRASTLIHYTGLDDGMLDAVLEIKGSYKIGKYMPGTRIPVLEEGELYAKQPEYALLFSWHIADELIPKVREKGFRGKFVVPLPEPRVVD